MAVNYLVSKFFYFYKFIRINVIETIILLDIIVKLYGTFGDAINIPTTVTDHNIKVLKYLKKPYSGYKVLWTCILLKQCNL